MPRVRDWLDRFRPAGAPGAATATAVPADRQAAAAAELEPVFATLAEDVLRAGAQRDQMVTEAAERTAQAQAQARAVIARAQAAADAERSAEETRLRQAATGQVQAYAEQGEAQAQEWRRRGTQRRAALVAEVIARVRTDIDELGHQARGQDTR